MARRTVAKYRAELGIAAGRPPKLTSARGATAAAHPCPDRRAALAPRCGPELARIVQWKGVGPPPGPHEGDLMHDIDRALFESRSSSRERRVRPARTSGPARRRTRLRVPVRRAGSYEFRELRVGTGRRARPSCWRSRTEAELDRFLGKLVSGAVSGCHAASPRSDAGRAVGGVLKAAAKQALPQLGRALGDVVAPGRGGGIGSAAGQWLGGKLELGLQTEGLSAEDRSTRRPGLRPVRERDRPARRAGAADACRRGGGQAGRGRRRRSGTCPDWCGPKEASGAAAAARQGRWIRRGNRIIVLDA